MNRIEGFVVDSLPKLQKLLLFQLFWVYFSFHIVPMRIFCRYRVLVIDGGENIHDGSCTVFDFLCHLDGAACLIRIVFIGQFAPFHVAITDQVLVDRPSQFRRDLDGISIGVGKYLVQK